MPEKLEQRLKFQVCDTIGNCFDFRQARLEIHVGAPFREVCV